MPGPQRRGTGGPATAERGDRRGGAAVTATAAAVTAASPRRASTWSAW